MRLHQKSWTPEHFLQKEILAGKKFIFVSLEMDRKELQARILERFEKLNLKDK